MRRRREAKTARTRHGETQPPAVRRRHASDNDGYVGVAFVAVQPTARAVTIHIRTGVVAHARRRIQVDKAAKEPVAVVTVLRAR